ncbi:bZIP transcription factor TRAB1 [Iris pallida]|uniref:BZIP transcription factor TRAB1 n=1 Tax=Iris pallida TaxID=29817 RepID=A0AAX6GHS0_IRIPA|nr:bZIP transcription factor TRAB1 [Iris pallida]
MMNFNNMGSGGKEARPPATPLPLARQLSVYSLTFDEFQSTLGGPGKDFGSMNMDEFLRNIWTAEESQAMASALGGGAGGASAAGADLGFAQGQSSAAGLQRQGSLTLPRTLSQKTVDEVWKDLLRESDFPQQQQQQQQQKQQQQQQQQRQPTLGEMTLEEFLVRAGVVREEMNQPAPVQRTTVVANNNSSNGSSTNMFFAELSGGANNNPVLGLGYPQAARTGVGSSSAANLAVSTTMTTTRPFPVLGGNVDLGNQQGMRGGGMVGMGDQGIGNGLVSNGLLPGMVGLGGGGATVATVGSPDGLGKGNGDLSSLSPVPFTFGAGIRGRKSSGAVEKVVERRQRRMIKNRESAARSRARKQAYTMELEAEVAKLKEQNQELQKKQEEIMEMQKNQVMEILNQQPGPKSDA